MSTWEERMAERARARRRACGELDPFRPADRDELAEQARAAYIAEHPGCLSPEPPPVQPDDYCRECCTWSLLGNWPGVYSWKVTCGFLRGECEHAHHADEIWLAG